MWRKCLTGGTIVDSAPVNLGLWILRVFTGLTMAFGHGLMKLPPADRFIEGVANLGFPVPVLFAWMAGLTEFAGGLLLALGLFTRPSAFLIFFTMMIAVFGQHAADPFGRKELALVYGVVSVVFLIVGSGRFGVDPLLIKKKTMFY